MSKYLDSTGLARLLKILDNRYLAPQNSIKNLILENVVTIGTDNFLTSGFYESISLPNCQYLGWWALQNNQYLTQVNLPKLEKCESYLLTDCTSLSSISLPSLKTAGSHLLAGCSSLTSASFGALEGVGSDALTDCPKLEKIILNNETVPAECFFTNAPDTCKLYVPSSALQAYKENTNWGTTFKERLFTIEESM